MTKTCPLHKHYRGPVRVVARPRGDVTIQAPHGEREGVGEVWERRP